jgi:molybdopterin molybdotransferase
LGKRAIQRATVQAASLERFDSPAGVRQYRRGVLHREANGGYTVTLVGGPGSHLIAAMASANCLVVIDEEVTEVVAGSRVAVLPLLLSNR